MIIYEIFKDIIELLLSIKNILFMGMILWLIYLVFYYSSMGLIKKCTVRPVLFLAYIVFVIYFFATLKRAWFTRIPGTFDRIDIIPFSTIFYEDFSIKLFIENIILFIPLGFLMPICFPMCRSFLRTLCCALAFSIIIECVQLFYQIGYAQTDDVLANLCGCILGWLGSDFQLRVLGNNK